MPQENSAKLIHGPIARIIIKMSLPMVAAMAGMLLFNLTDTFFIGKLGKDQLAALTFTFPVILFFVSLALGIGTGTSAVVSRAIGEGNQQKVKRVTTDSLILIFLISLVGVIIGLLTIDPLFSFFGASGHILGYVKEYMLIWYSGVVFVMIPMVGNNAIRATGDTKTPAQIMMVAVVVNIILDPIFIFGWGPVPGMGIQGAAFATLISRATTLLAAIRILGFRDKMISFIRPKFSELINSFSLVLKIGIPTALTRILLPVGTGIITKMIATYGVAAVAAFGIGSRIEILAITPFIALSSVIGPFVGQNAGANLFQRIITAVKGSYIFVATFGIVAWLAISFSSQYLVSIFNNDAEVVRIGILYLWISPTGFAFIGLAMISSTVLNVMNRPIKSGMLSILQMFIIYIPLAWVLSMQFGLVGIYYGGPISYLIVGLLSIIITNREINNQRIEYEQ